MSDINFPARDEEAIALLKSDPDAYFARFKDRDLYRALARIAEHSEQLRAAVRLLTDSGDITPMGARILNNIANQWEGK